MSILNTLKLNSNPKIQINFDGGELSSDSGLFLLKEFISAIGLENILYLLTIWLAYNAD